MRFGAFAWVIVCCQAAVSLIGGDAFVISRSSTRRAAALSERRGGAIRAATADQLERIADGAVLDLRGGKTTGSKKASSGKGGKSSSSSSKGKSSKLAKSKKEPKKPSFLATLKAFFKSLIDPHFALKLQAKKEKHSTVHA